MEKFTFIYDREVDSLFVCREGRKIHDSVMVGEIIISFDKDYHLAAIEILNPDLLYRIPKKRLSKISSAKIQVQQRGDVMWIYVILSFKDARETETLPVQLQMERPLSA
ncbi:MAG: DUF2283 domain-containing protein [Candidatus Aenigmarchaeota archaeon]|nr:DUF2283 domain-containing protein [Candidatus Aenigmarchaeota archaeon]